jgi:hypothetical protein
MGVPLIYSPSGVAFCFTAGIQLATRNLDVFVWVVVRAGSPNIGFFVGVPALKNQQEFMENCIRYNIRFILWLDAENAFKRVMATDGGTGMEVNHQWILSCLVAFGEHATCQQNRIARCPPREPRDGISALYPRSTGLGHVLLMISCVKCSEEKFSVL